MKWTLFIALLGFLGCSALTDNDISEAFTPMTDDVTMAYHKKGASYLSKWMGLNESDFDEVRYWIGNDESFEKVGIDTSDSEAFLVGHNVLIHEDVLKKSPLCYVIAHELGHFASDKAFGDGDGDHCRLGNNCTYDFMNRACLTLAVK